MGNQETTGLDFSEKTSLIDFLYIDKEKVDSFISQLQNGALRSVKTTNDITQGFSVSGEGSIPALAKGSVNNSNQDKNALEKQYDPYHSQLIELLNFLNLTILNDIPLLTEAQIVLLESQISIRNLDTLKKTIPILRDNKEAFGFTNKNFKTVNDTIKLVESMFGIMPLSIDIELTFDSGISVNGPIKESGLSIKSDDLFRSYGTLLPGKWYTLGIIDKRPKYLPNPNANQSLYAFIDQIASSMSEVYTKSMIQISPILVFRSVSV